jgi:hypothetical protein
MADDDWIPVSSQLPESGETVIVYQPKGSLHRVFTARLSRIASAGKNLWWIAAHHAAPLEAISHWMPLPPPPSDGARRASPGPTEEE